MEFLPLGVLEFYRRTFLIRQQIQKLNAFDVPSTNDFDKEENKQQQINKQLTIIDNLTQFAAEKQRCTCVLTGGYAVEAISGGKITRLHGDVDLLWFGDFNPEETIERLKSLGFEDVSFQKVQLSDKEEKIIFKAGDNKIEIRIKKSKLEKELYKKRLIYGDREIEVFTFSVNALIISKLYAFLDNKTPHDQKRKTRDTDWYDLLRLIKNPDFSLGKILVELKRHKKLNEFSNLLEDLLHFLEESKKNN
ncbi:MAG: nucleotidyl transferase AbiEii/AbiGii toxin family protein [Patescibacteria group bacterium]|nr:nucleotidyl transferase AbiEii/AbiGii toxin family protein [Patescibacteria group bacterium]